MKVQPGIKYSPAQWYNSTKYKVSYKRMYKSASSTIIDLIGEGNQHGYTQTAEPMYEKRFTVIREPFDRSESIYREMVAQKKLEQRGINSYLDYLHYTDAIGFFDKHQFPQTHWLKDAGEIAMFRLENLPALAEWLNVPADAFKHINKRTLEVYTGILSYAMVFSLYRADFDLYNSIK